MPTGAAYNSASAFEHLTTKRHYLKPLASCRIVSAGQYLTGVETFSSAGLDMLRALWSMLCRMLQPTGSIGQPIAWLPRQSDSPGRQSGFCD